MLNYDRSYGYSSLPGPYYLWNNAVPMARLRAANGANVAVQPTENNLIIVVSYALQRITKGPLSHKVKFST